LLVARHLSGRAQHIRQERVPRWRQQAHHADADAAVANVYQFEQPACLSDRRAGWNRRGIGIAPQVDNGRRRPPHNFSFTSELHYPFTYDASKSPTFEFTGDDDVWVFINGQLAVDLGGVHGPRATAASMLDIHDRREARPEGQGMYSIDMSRPSASPSSRPTA